MTNKIKNNLGFTLMELMVAVAIIAIMAAFGTPALLEAYGNFKLRGEARNLYSAFQKARSESIRQNDEVIMVFCEAGDPLASDGIDNRYLVFFDNGPSPAGGNGVWDNSEKLIVDVKMPSDITLVSSSFTGTQSDTFFNSRGIPKKLGTIIMRNDTRWYRLSLGIAGNVNMQISLDGTWP